MGTFNVQVTAVGGHGCQREVKGGSEVYGCRNMNCPDCITREYVERLQRTGANVSEAKLTHWPGQPGQVVDDLLTRKREGSF
jgi:hypothetical protein